MSTIHPLARWLFEQQERPSNFAKRIGVAPSHMSRVLRRLKMPSMQFMAKVEAATEGAVRPNDFLPARPDATQEQDEAA